MTTKNLEKLAEIGEKNLRDDLIKNLFDIKEILTEIQEEVKPNNNLDKKMKSYNHLIATCKNCGLDVTEDEKIYSEIINEAKKYLNEKEKQFFSELSVKTQYEDEIKY